jgi:hypothetical protein
MQRYLIGDTDEARQRMREEILSTTAADLRNFADAMAHLAAGIHEADVLGPTVPPAVAKTPLRK